MKKRIGSIILAVVLIVSSIFVYDYFNEDVVKVYAADFREGYQIKPIKVDASGVHVDSGFEFSWKDEHSAVSAKELQNVLTVKPEIEFSVKEEADHLIIQPKELLSANQIYIFGYNDVTFAYKTEAEFSLLGTFPKNESTNVPINTGIEFIFNYSGADVEDYFSIEPAAKGRFEVHDRVVVFVPEKLQAGTVYTVTLKKGLSLKDSDKALQEETRFSFETESEGQIESKGYISFNQLISEFAVDETPILPWEYYIENQKADKKAKVNVFSYSSAKSFAKDLEAATDIFSWSYYNATGELTSTDELQKVMSFGYELTQDEESGQYIKLPEKLTPGYYIVDVTWEDVHIQTYFQVTDLAFYYNESTTGSLFWIHDLKTGEPIEGATVKPLLSNEGSPLSDGISDKDGIVNMLGDRRKPTEKVAAYQIVGNKKESVAFIFQNSWSWKYYDNNQEGYYWKYFKPDRNLYKPDDTVKFFGFLKNRYSEETLNNVSVELTRGGYYYFNYLPYSVDQLSLVSVNEEVKNGFFEGSLDLPNLDEGSYQLVVKKDGEILTSSYIQVENYTKPSYKLEVEKDKKAIFDGDKITFTLHSLFYEGTPVSKLDYTYNINGYDYYENSGTTDLLGKAEFGYIPEYTPEAQDYNYAYMYARAELPESGDIWVDESFRVFYNDINIDTKASYENGVGTIDINSHYITLDRLNDDTAENDEDYLADPVADKVVTVDIIRNEWIKTEIGEYYDYINKEVRKRYEYSKETKVLKTVEMVTDSQGKAQLELELPDENSVYYTAELRTTDNNGRKMKYNLYFNRKSRYDSDREYYNMELNKESYAVQDIVQVTVKKNDKVMDDGDYLFLASQNGVIDYRVSNKSVTEMEFLPEYVPMIRLKGIWFNGKTYVEMANKRVVFDYSQNEINLHFETDKEKYIPGEPISVSMYATTTNPEGETVRVADGVVNVSLVDEALFALSEQYNKPLEELYTYVDDGFINSYTSHNGNNDFGINVAPLRMAFSEKADMAISMEMDANGEGLSGVSEKGTSDVSVRSNFQDTAQYKTLYLDENGEGTFEFELPDNVTAWRMTGAAFSKDLQAGSQVESINVSLPFFINTSLNSMYLTGDKPMIGATVYGSQLSEGEMLQISLEVYKDEKLLRTTTKEGKAFERINLSAGAFDEAGEYRLIVKALKADGSGDAVQSMVQVYDTYHEKEMIKTYAVEKGMNIQTNDSGNTKLTFVDKGRGYFLPTLYELAYTRGKRVDQKYLSDYVRNYLNENYDDSYELDDVKITDYMDESGGIAILPYAEPDIYTTVHMLSLIKEDINTMEATLYLKNNWYSEELTEKGAVLYGLALLDEPILLDLEAYAKTENLSVIDKLYVSLAYAEIGDTYMAGKLMEEAVGDNVTEYETRAYINLGKDEDKNLEATALTMLIADKIGDERHEKFYDYVTHTRSKEVITNAETASYIFSRIKQTEAKKGGLSYTYNGQSRTMTSDNGYAQTITLPSASLSNLHIDSVTGDMIVVVSYKEKLEGKIGNDENIHIKRKYINYQTKEETRTFKEGDIVQVVLDWDILDGAIDEFYQVTDYVPSGLKPIENSWRMGLDTTDKYGWYRDMEDQKVSFYIYKMKDKENYRPLTYYARIVSLGEFMAEAPIVQGTQIKDSICIGDTDMIRIQD